MLIHSLFDCLAALTAWALIGWTHARLGRRAEAPAFAPRYGLWLVVGAIGGAYVFGTANLILSDMAGIGRSILGALAGAILAVEMYKRRAGLRGSTGVVLAPGFAAAVAVGRIGCYLAGLPDQTYGTPTALPWGHDFGDGILRHPVQLYESAAMAGFAVLAMALIQRRSPVFLRQGFYLMVGWYGLQRFVWEFFKPYAPILGPLNLFHLTCLGLLAYAAIMIAKDARNV